MANRDRGSDCSGTEPTLASDETSPDATASDATAQTLASDAVAPTLASEEQPGSSVAALATPSVGPAAGPDATFRAVGTAGRYVLLEQIGEGGLGVVYQAYDPDLGRRVAVKIVRAARQTSSRMLREAQALARLAHPNVIQVYDVGMCDRGVFIAMELGDGVTLRSWLGVRERSVDEILAVFAAAGRGLLAAHRAGLVHRDFKPDNVIVGDDGRARVLDFGLACTADEGESDSQVDDSPVSGTSADFLKVTLTRTGAMLGTPRYMSPEQYLRRRVDARTDQFSFCVSLYEALHGHAPFEGKNLHALGIAVTRGDRSTEHPRRALPKSVERVLDRGLSIEPEARYSSMQELLRELVPPARRTTRRLTVAAALLASLLTAMIVWASSRNTAPGEVCAGAGERVGEVWNSETRARAEAAFIATGKPDAAATFARAAAALDGYAAAWQDMHAESCRATRVHGHQSEALMDLRTRCLDRRLVELGALVDLFGRADEQVVASAVDAAYALPPLGACEDTASLQGISALPDDPSARGRIEELRNSLAAASVLSSAAKYSEAVDRARPLLEAARAVDYPPLTAEVLYLVGYLEERSGDPEKAVELLNEAIVTSARAGDGATEARSFAQLLWVIGYRLERGDDALLLRPAVDAALVRTSDVLAHAWVKNNLGSLHARRGELGQAKRYLEEALALKRTGLNPGDPDLGKTLNNLGFIAIELGDVEAAARYFREAAEIVEKAHGPKHGDLAQIHSGLGNVAIAQQRYLEARKHCERALAIDGASLGEASPELAYDLACIGEALVGTREWDAATAVLERAVMLASSSPAPDTNLLTSLRATLERARARGEK